MVTETLRDRQREETRRRLFEAALEVFRRDGFHSCRIDDIARKAEVSRAAFYFHFPSKDDVLLEFAARAEGPMVQAIDALPKDIGLLPLLREVSQQWTRFWKDEPKLVVDTMAVQLRAEASRAKENRPGALRSAVVRRFVAAGEQLAPALAPDALADFFQMTCLAAVTRWATTPAEPLDTLMEKAVQLFLTGAKRR